MVRINQTLKIIFGCSNVIEQRSLVPFGFIRIPYNKEAIKMEVYKLSV